MCVGLDAGLLVLLRESDVPPEVGPSHSHRADHGERNDDACGPETARVDFAAHERHHEQRSCCNEDPDNGGDRGREHDAHRARDGRHPADTPVELEPRQRDRRRPEHERCCGERREVVKAEEGELSPTGRTGDEDVRAEELYGTNDARESAPRGHDQEHEPQLRVRAEDQNDCGREQRVLEELRGRDRVLRAGVSGRPKRDQDVDPDPHEIQRRAEPEGPPASQRREASAHPRYESRDDDRQNREVGQLHADRRRTGRDVELRLVPEVDEQDRDRPGQDERLRAHARERNGHALPQGHGSRRCHGGESSDRPP